MVLQKATTLVEKPLPLEEAILSSMWYYYDDNGLVGTITFNSDGSVSLTPNDSCIKYWQWNKDKEYIEIL